MIRKRQVAGREVWRHTGSRAGQVVGCIRFCPWAVVQMRAEEHVERHAGEALDGEQHATGGQMLAGFPMAPGGGGDAELVGGKGDVEVLAHTPVLEPHAERDARGVMMAVMIGFHRGGVGRDQTTTSGRMMINPPG